MFILYSAFAAVVAYFVVGAVILRARYQKSGSDLIIHKSFWMDFPFLVKVIITSLYNLMIYNVLINIISVELFV